MELHEYTSEKPQNDHPQDGLFLSSEVTDRSSPANITTPGDIQRHSSQFFANYHDLLPNLAGTIMQVGWNADTGPCAVADRHASIVTLGFSAKKHMAGAELRSDGNGNKFYGTGIYEWQVVQTHSTGRAAVRFATGGDTILDPTEFHWDSLGRSVHHEPAGDQRIEDVWGMILEFTTHEMFERQVVDLRHKRLGAIRELSELLMHQTDLSYREFLTRQEKQYALLAKQGFGCFMPIEASFRPSEPAQHSAILREYPNQATLPFGSPDQSPHVPPTECLPVEVAEPALVAV